MNGNKKYITSTLLVCALCMCLCTLPVYAAEAVTDYSEAVEGVLEQPDVSSEEDISEDTSPDPVEIVEDPVETDVPVDTTGNGSDGQLQVSEDNSEIVALLNEINLKLTPEEEIPVEVVKEDYRIFTPLQAITQGEATTTDVYNVLVALHNLGLLFLIVYLIVWSSEKIVSAFRRFIY